ncbi:MAG TPA: TonB-dependent receptor, partial [Kofleriaceae bacterium]|nr:TonB-dependent receptor [Kofleriaceae bacterium]
RAQATLRRDRPDGSDRLTGWFGRDRAYDDLAAGLVPAALHADTWVAGARASQHTRLDERATLTIGLDVDGAWTRLERDGSLTIPAREGDPHVFGQPPGDDVATDRWRATTVDAAGHAALDVRLRRVTATVGLRADGWLLAASRLTPRIGSTPPIASQDVDLTFDPRLSVQVSITGAVAVHVDGGRYHQARDPADTSAVFGTPGLAREQAWHATAGAQWRHAPFAVEVAGYARLLDELVARDPSPTPLVAHALTQDGSGRVVGAQLTVRASGWHGLSGWLAYGWSRSTRRDAAGADPRLFDGDQPHDLVAAGAWTRGAWTLGGRLRASSGEPRTDVVGAYFDSRSGRYQPVRGPTNGVRLPAYAAIDLRGERRLRVGPARVAAYLEVQNVTARANAEELVYSADFRERGTLTGLPFLALAGVEVQP